MSAHTAFPADGYTARWQTWDTVDDETLTLRWENEGWTVSGEVGRERIHYVLRLSPTWHTRQFLLFRDFDAPDLWLATDGHARWGEMNGAHRPELDGCHDIDLDCTPFTNTLPIRRLPLDVGDEMELPVVLVDVETLSVVPVRHRFQRLAPRRWTLERSGSGEVSEFDVDEYGLVLDAPDRFRRR
ncbi:putative glycolipid-binding domain-containing protein [soil metagenome]